MYQEKQPIKNKVMNATDLKNSRNEIIARIKETADSSKMAEIMTGMLNLVNNGMNESNNPVSLVDEVVELFGYGKKISINRIEDLRQESIRNQRGSSLR